MANSHMQNPSRSSQGTTALTHLSLDQGPQLMHDPVPVISDFLPGSACHFPVTSETVNETIKVHLLTFSKHQPPQITQHYVTMQTLQSNNMPVFVLYYHIKTTQCQPLHRSLWPLFSPLPPAAPAWTPSSQLPLSGLPRSYVTCSYFFLTNFYDHACLLGINGMEDNS